MWSPIKLPSANCKGYLKAILWLLFFLTILSESLSNPARSSMGSRNSPYRNRRQPMRDYRPSYRTNGPEQYNFNYPEEYGTSSEHMLSPPSFARQMMGHSSSPGNLPLFRQSYPMLYLKGNLKKMFYEPTTKVKHRYYHHGRDGHKFLVEHDPSLFVQGSNYL